MCPPIRILHLVDQLDGFGRAGQLRLLVEAQIRDGHQPEVVALRADHEVLKSWATTGIPCRWLQRRWPWDPFAVWRLARLRRQQALSLLHTWGGDSLAYLQFATPAASLPTIATLWETPPAWLLKRLPEYVVTPTSQTFSTHVIPPGIIDSKVEPVLREEISRDSWPRDAPLIAVGGRLVRENRVDEAIWSFELIRSIDPRVRLLIFGDGPDRPRLERFTRLVSESEVVNFLGYRQDLGKLLPHVDVMWSMGNDRLAYPLTVLEAMALGRPVVAVDQSAIGQVIAEQGGGFNVALDDRAKRAKRTLTLLEEQQAAQTASSAAAQLLQEKFRVEKMITAYSELYQNALSQDGATDLSRRAIPEETTSI